MCDELAKLLLIFYFLSFGSRKLSSAEWNERREGRNNG